MSERTASELKTFNVRVAIVEPGIIDTAMARRIGDPAPGSPYGQTARFSALFSKSLETPVPPSLVAEKILEVAQSESWQLRYPVGPDAAGFLEWRRNMTDEEWVEMNAGDDATFFAKLGSS